jgi:hypothetical protein
LKYERPWILLPAVEIVAEEWLLPENPENPITSSTLSAVKILLLIVRF